MIPTRFLRVTCLWFLATLLAGCATRPPEFPEPLRPPVAVGSETSEQPPTRERVVEGPTVEGAQATVPSRETAAIAPDIPSRDPVSLVIDGMPLPAFINVVFGEELGFPIEIDQSVRARQELVSLRFTDPQPPEKVFLIAEQILADYGIDVTQRGDFLRFSPAADPASGTPTLITTRSLPDVPAGQRPVFVAVPLNASEPGRIAGQVRSLLGNQSVTLTEMLDANALLISGTGDEVQVAMEAVLTLDRPSLRDRHSLRINPLYLPVDQLADELREVLEAQGYSVRDGAGSSGVLAFVPVASANALVVFSESQEALDAVRQWTVALDQPTDDGGSGGVYLYAARHTTVETLMPILQTLEGGTSAPGGTGSGFGSGTDDPATQDATSSNQGVGTSFGGAGGQVAVDPVRNVIVFQGDPQRWRAIRDVLARLDQPARQVVIEVTVAEVTLSDELSHGIEWALENVNFAGMSGPLTGLAGGAANSGGLVWQAISGSGQVSAILNLFGKDSRVTILSTPRLMVKSGETASIDVGTEVPIITSQATAPDLPSQGGDSSILQQIQYRKTGVLLEIEAVVHSGQRVDLHLVQEVSEATPTDTSEISSPSIFSRRLETSLSLSDGESMLLGGLISSSDTDGKTKVPLLGDIPVVGRLFQSRRTLGARTELLMLITPYVVEDASQAREITDAIQARFGDGEER